MTHPKPNPVIGITLKVLSALSFALMSALVKNVADRYPTGEIVFFRSLFALVPLVVWLAWRGEFPGAMRTQRPLGHFRRGLIGSLGMYCGFTALAFLPLTEAVAIGYAAPLLTVVLAALILKESVRIQRWSAVAIGLTGVLIMLAPHLGGSAPSTGAAGLAGLSGAAIGALAAFTGAACAAGASIETRQLTRTETTGAIVFYFMTLTTLVGLVTALFQWQTPGALDAAQLVACGVLGGIGQILMTQSFRYADASLIAPFDYTSMLWAMILGYLLFGQWPTLWVLTGAGIVAASGIFVIWRERQLGLARAREVESAPPRGT